MAEKNGVNSPREVGWPDVAAVLGTFPFTRMLAEASLLPPPQRGSTLAEVHTWALRYRSILERWVVPALERQGAHLADERRVPGLGPPIDIEGVGIAAARLSRDGRR